MQDFMPDYTKIALLYHFFLFVNGNNANFGDSLRTI